MTKRIPKTKILVEEFIKRGIYSPTEMARLYELNYGEKLTEDAFRMAMMRLGISERALRSQSKEKLPSRPRIT